MAASAGSGRRTHETGAGGKSLVGTVKVFIAEALGETGDVTAGLEEIDQAFAAMEEIGEAITKAEAHRIKGKLLLMRSEANAGEAESCFRKAIEIAQKARPASPAARQDRPISPNTGAKRHVASQVRLGSPMEPIHGSIL